MELLTVEETAKLLKVNPVTVRRYIADGRLSAVKVGRRVRIYKEAVAGLLAPVVPNRRVVDDHEREREGVMKATDQIIPRVLTPDERERGLAAVRELRRLHQEMRSERPEKPVPSSLELLDEAREERSRDLA